VRQVIGLDAISSNNGWAMALTGALIVMCGLALLAAIISQLHKVIALFEKKPLIVEKPIPESAPSFAQLSAEVDILNDLAAAARIYQSVLGERDESFKLTQLYAACTHEQMPHPHLTIRALRDSGYLQPCGDGLFCWDKSLS
jgi:hypothetical protein